MHIPDGLLPPQFCIAGYALTGGMTWYSLRQIKREGDPQAKIPKASLLTAAFFVASLIHIPVPPTSIHLVLNGLMGIILGYYAFPAILIGLFFQAVFFGHGGISTLGLNAAMMGIPALGAYYLYQWGSLWTRRTSVGVGILPFCAGAFALASSATIFVGVTLMAIPAEIDGRVEQQAIYLSSIGYGIQAILEGTFTMMAIAFLDRVKPELLERRRIDEN